MEVAPVGEVGGERGVLGDEDSAGVGGVAIVPPDEFVAACGGGIDGLIDMLGQFTIGWAVPMVLSAERV